MNYETLLKKISQHLIEEGVPEEKVLNITNEKIGQSVKYIKLKTIGKFYGVNFEIPIETRINAGLQSKKNKSIENSKVNSKRESSNEKEVLDSKKVISKRESSNEKEVLDSKKVISKRESSNENEVINKKVSSKKKSKSKRERKLKPCKSYQKRNSETNRCIGRKPKKPRKSARKNPWIDFVKTLRSQSEYKDVPYRELLKIASGLWKKLK